MAEPKVNMIMAVHMVTPVILCHHYSRLMKERGSGYILNVSSLAAWMPYPGMAMYSATKRFIKSFSRSLRIELLHTGVTVTTAFFGAVDTGLYRLSDRLRKAARRVSVMISAREAASKALDAMFKGRSTVMPGFLNHLAIPIVSTLSERNLNHLDRKYGKKFV
jgi:short-subunit dehydrogenase